MSVRKRSWITATGEPKTAWVVDYADMAGKRRLKTFARKKEADAFAATAHIEIREGTHVADRDTVAVAAAGKLWIARGEAAGLERSMVEAYRQRLDLHIVPFIGGEKMSRITVPVVRAFADRVRSEGRSPAMVKKALTALGSILSDAQERGLCTRNAVKEMSHRHNGAEKRSKRLLQPGVDILSLQRKSARSSAFWGALAVDPPHGSVQRAPVFRASRSPMAGCGPDERHDFRSPAIRQMGRDRRDQVTLEPAHLARPAGRGEHLAGMEARLSAG